ncbi:P-type conjugative transfer protein TrbJ [Rheinheimera pacifica]|uniref:hypothetical protein n=1 Tax=Rheinheimera pacifica TaxID=173990 RepID=UPI00216AA738|nr:hypothetical protein [Rheinheimera pacifica]MCS4309499.1 P-type conjugative transfer protein TrbJ [Rheinheimera pacifica]
MKKAIIALFAMPFFVYSIPVFDPSNFIQNTFTALQTLQSNANEVRTAYNQLQQIQNELVMLENDAKNLKKLDFNTLAELENMLYNANSILSKSSSTFANIEQASRIYDEQFGNYNNLERFDPSEDYYDNVNARLQLSHQASRDAIESLAVLKSQAADLQRTNDLVNESQRADGTLAAIQAQTQIQAQLIHEMKSLENLTAQGVKQHSLALADENMNKALGSKQKEQFWGGMAIGTKR